MLKVLHEVNLVPVKNKAIDGVIQQKLKRNRLGKLARNTYQNKRGPKHDLVDSFSDLKKL